MSPRVFLRFPIHCIRNYGYPGMGLHKDSVSPNRMMGIINSGTKPPPLKSGYEGSEVH